MTQIPILSGVYADLKPDFRTIYPRNLVPVPKQTGLSNGHLRPADGLVEFSPGVGPDRGGIVWEGVHYRAQGTKLISVSDSGVVSVLGDIGPGGPVRFDYSFDYLAMSSGGRFYIYDGSTLQQNVDPDLGPVNSFVWLDQYFVTTDGEFLVVTEISDPLSVNPLKYGSSEVDPDPVVSLLELRNELYALNRYSIEVFNNVGGSGFPFARILGAQVQKGVVGPDAAAVFDDKIAFVGGGRGEPPAVYVALNGGYNKLSTSDIDDTLQEYSDQQISQIVLESRNERSHVWLYIHLPDKTIVFDAAATRATETPVWFTLSGGIVDEERYPARHFLWANDMWLSGDPTTGKIGKHVRHTSDHFGEPVKWEFHTAILYNAGNGAIIHELELVGLTGEVALGSDPAITTQYTNDGVSWSQPDSINIGGSGARGSRLAWRRQGQLRHWRSQRFFGPSSAHITIASLEAKIEGLQF